MLRTKALWCDTVVRTWSLNMGANRYSSCNPQGLVAKEWQSVIDHDGVTRTKWRSYGYDALGQQTHIYDLGIATGVLLCGRRWHHRCLHEQPQGRGHPGWSRL